MPYTWETHPYLHFDGFSTCIYTGTYMHALSAVITNPVRGRVFLLEVFSGTAKLNDIENLMDFSINQISHILLRRYCIHC